MLIKTTVASGREVRGWIKRLDDNEKKIYLDKHLSFVDERDEDEKIDLDNEEVGNFIVLHWFQCSSFYELLLPYPFDLDTNYR